MYVMASGVLSQVQMYWWGLQSLCVERQLSALVAAMPQNSSFLESESFLLAAEMPIVLVLITRDLAFSDPVRFYGCNVWLVTRKACPGVSSV
jgi:hypothetical protein